MTHHAFLATVYFALCGTPRGKLCACQISKCLIGLGRKTFPGRVSLFFWRCTRLVRISLSSTWPLRTSCQHTPVSKSTYVTSFCHAKAVLKISRSRGMFWIFQDKDCFRFFFVEHETFFFQRWWVDLDFWASFPHPVFLVQLFSFLFFYCLPLMQHFS